MPHTTISSGSTFEAQIGYSRAVVDEHYVFVSGTTGYDYTNMTMSDDLITQAKQCIANIDQALNAAGTSAANVVRVRYIFPQREDFEPCWPVLRAYFGPAAPAATMIVAGLASPDMRLEIEVTARL